ncbi:TolC family protein [Thermospira aquatica]|uniref:TolC family protein n=1 Tax=Thermospira aquatica TaxID=2828656 RepID=A0AAX3BAZ5_9SPIR|nr:TolC family protein [Thermospira aquatica]URA09271.1 TolC family protein [Thermospira aquatica]
MKRFLIGVFGLMVTWGMSLSPDLEVILTTALQNNPTLRQYRLDADIAEAQYQQAWADFWLPDVSAGASFTYLDPDTVERGKMSVPEYTMTNLNLPVIGGAGGYVPVPTMVPSGFTTNQTVFADNYGIQFQVAKPLFLGFRLANALKIRELNLKLARQKFQDQQQSIKTSVIQSYYNILVLKENIRLSRQLSDALRKRYEFMQANYRAGLVSDYDVLKMEVQYKNTLPSLQKLETTYQTVLQQFFQLVGTNLEPSGQIMDATNLILSRTNEAEILEYVMSNNINLVQIRVSREIQEYTYRLQQADRLPTINSFFTLKYDYRLEKSGETERKWIPSWTIGVSVSVPLDEWLPFSKNSALLKETRLSQEKTDLAIKTLEDQLSLQVKSLLAQLADQKQTIEAQSLNMRQAQRGLEMANDRYRQGVVSSLDVTDAEASYSQAQVNYLQSIYDYVNTVVKLKQLLYEL